jgi:hypothetical protein
VKAFSLKVHPPLEDYPSDYDGYMKKLHAEWATEPYELNWGKINKIRDNDTHWIKSMGIPDCVVETVRQEEAWVQDEDFPRFPLEDREAIGLDKMQCPFCKGRKTIELLHKGKVTGKLATIEDRCSCVAFRLFYMFWSGKRAMVPEGYRWVHPRTLKPSPKINLPITTQEDLIEMFRAHPFDSYLMLGPPRTGKTVYSTMLLQNALNDWAFNVCFKEECSSAEAVWRIGAPKLAEQFLMYETRSTIMTTPGYDPENTYLPQEPLVTERKIEAARRGGHIPRLFLDEIDKLNMTDARRRWISGIGDAIYANGGQMVVNSNMTLAGLEDHMGPLFGPPFIRRITDADGADIKNDAHGHFLNFFDYVKK